MRVIGTAGHVDHGKSTLIEALTGIHPDRLKEEQAREMTIELGFGWLTLPNGEEVGIVDVPGHRDFIENMLAGIGGIDAALLIIAADEGIMPQTKEHLAILNLLQITSALVVLTKTDLASDSGWLDLLEGDIRQTLHNTPLQHAPIIRVSAKNKTGIENLISNIQSLLEEKPTRLNLNRPRLPIDRVFSISGFGTVVTGTLSDGNLQIADEIEILPSKLKGRVRGLQTHQKKEEIATIGSRTAVNISGIDVNSIQRGDVLVHPNQYQTTRRIDAKLQILSDVDYSIKHNDEVKIFIGASETIANIRLLNNNELNAGDDVFVQLELHSEIVTVRGDRYILRRPSPSQTIGGGVVIDHQPKGRHKLFDEDVIKSLESLSQGSPIQLLLEATSSLQIATFKEVIIKSRLEPSLAETTLQEALKNNLLITISNAEGKLNNDALLMTQSDWSLLQIKIIDVIKKYHFQFPLRRGIPREELKSKLKLSPKHFNAMLSHLVLQTVLQDNRDVVSMPEHKIMFTQQQQAAIESMRRRFTSSPYATPSFKECQEEVGEEVLNALIDSGELIQVSADVLFRKIDYDDMVEKIKLLIQKNGQTSLADVRDIFKTTRKYAQALLEHLDAIQITVRAGDARKLK